MAAYTSGATTLTLSAAATATGTVSGTTYGGGSLNIGYGGSSQDVTYTAGSTAATLASSSSSIQVGMPVWNPNAPSGTYVAAVSGTSLMLSSAATATASSSPTAIGGVSYGVGLVNTQLVEHLDFHGDINSNETVFDEGSGTRLDIFADDASDYAYWQFAGVAWAGKDIAIDPNMEVWSELPLNNGFAGTGSDDGAGPNSCVACTFSFANGVGFRIGHYGIHVDSLQDSGNNVDLWVPLGAGEAVVENTLLEYVNNTSGSSEGVADIAGTMTFYNVNQGPPLLLENNAFVDAYAGGFGAPVVILPSQNISSSAGYYANGVLNAHNVNTPNGAANWLDSSILENVQGAYNSNGLQVGASDDWKSLKQIRPTDANPGQYEEVRGDWNMVTNCATYSTSPCTVYSLQRGTLPSAGMTWRVVLAGDFYATAGEESSTGPILLYSTGGIELTSSSPSVTVSNGTSSAKFSIAEDTSGSDGGNLDQLVIYSSTGNVEFVGRAYIFAGASQSTPTVQYTAGEFGTSVLGGSAAQLPSPGPIGATTPSTGAFTALTASTSVTTPTLSATTSITTPALTASTSISTATLTASTSVTAGTSVLGGSAAQLPSPGPIGATTPGTGAFTALTDTGLASQNCIGTSSTGLLQSGPCVSTASTSLQTMNGPLATPALTASTSVTAPTLSATTSITTPALTASTSISTATLTASASVTAGTSVLGGSSPQIPSPGPIGTTTPNTGAFTALTDTGLASQNCVGTSSAGQLEAGNCAPAPLTGTTGSIGGTALSAGQCASGTVSIAGLPASGARLTATPDTYPGDGFWWEAYPSAAGTATVKVCAVVAGTPAASTYFVSQ